jgi:WD40 repeat protein
MVKHRVIRSALTSFLSGWCLLACAGVSAQPDPRALTIRTSNGVQAFCYSPDGTSFAYSHFEGLTVEIKSAGGMKISTLRGNRGRVHALAFSPDGRTLATGGLGAPLCLWDVTTGKVRVELAERTDFVADLVFCPDGKALAVAHTHRDEGLKKITIWDLDTRKALPPWT